MQEFPFLMKKINILTALLFTFAILNVSGQSWIKYYGQGLNAVCRSVTNDYDHGFVIGGMVNNYKYLWLLKTDVNGNVLWDRRIGNGVNDCGIGNVEKTLDGGYILCGSWTKLNPSWDAFIIKFNACAEIEWCKVLETLNNYDMGIKIKQTPEGDYILMGGYFVTNPVSNTSLFKLNPNGELIWHQFYPFDYNYNEDQPRDLLINTDGYFITSSRYAPDSGSASPQIIRSYFVKTDTAGNKLWDLLYGVNNHYYSNVWSTVSNNMEKYYHSCTHTGETTTNPALIWISHNGLESEDKDLVETNSHYFCGMPTITMFHDTSLIFVGGYRINNVFQYQVIRTDTLGNVKDFNFIPYVEGDYTSTTKTYDDKFVTVGNEAPNGNFNIIAIKVNSHLEYDSIYTQPFTYDSLCPHPIVSDTIDPNCDNVIVSVDEPFKKPETTQLKVYPNPTDNIITIELPKYLIVTNNSGNIPATTVYHQWSSATLQAIDLQGKTVLQKEVANTGVPMQLDVSKLPAGMYLFRLVYQGKQVAESKVVVK